MQYGPICSKRDLHLNAQSDSPDTTRSAADFADYFAFPRNHWRQIEINNPLERNIREIRWHIRVVGLILPTNGGHLTRRFHRLER